MQNTLPPSAAIPAQFSIISHNYTIEGVYRMELWKFRMLGSIGMSPLLLEVLLCAVAYFHRFIPLFISLLN